MTIKVLTQESVDHLRAITKAGTDILARDYDSLVATYSVKEVDLDVTFDDSILLRLPDGSRQEENYDAENCMLIAQMLPDLSEINATDERLWVTLSLKQYRNYALERWPLKDDTNIVNHRINHWFASNTRGLMGRHSLSRLWWSHQLCSRISSENVDETLKSLLFNSDYRSSMLERNTTSAVTEVVQTIILISEEKKKQGVLYNREKFRDFMKSLDMLAGRSTLSVLDEAQLKAVLEDLYVKAYS